MSQPSTSHLTWLWGAHAVRLTGALQAIQAQQIYFLADQPPPMQAPQLVVLSSEPAEADQLTALNPLLLGKDFEQQSLKMIDWIQRAIRLMRKTSRQHKGTIVVLAAEQPDTPKINQVLTLTRNAGISNLMQSLAREWGKRGIHIVYLPIVAGTDPHALAQLCWQLHQQPISSWSYQPQLLHPLGS